MKVLGIDTSNQSLALTLSENEKIIGNYLSNIKQNHSIALMPAIDLLMEKNHWQPQDLERIIVAKGPGSYTGLRIGVTTAKTLAWTLGIELVAVSSLASLAGNAVAFPGMIVPLFDARRRNVYTGMYQWQAGQLVMVKKDRHISLTEWLRELQGVSEPILFVGEDVALFAEEIVTVFDSETICQEALVNTVNGISLIRLGMELEAVTDVSAFVPEYLKLVEAEEKWLLNHQVQETNYVEKI